MYTWGDTYGRLSEQHTSRERELQEIHLAELAAEEKAERRRRTRVNLSILALPFVFIVHALLGFTRIVTVRH